MASVKTSNTNKVSSAATESGYADDAFTSTDGKPSSATKVSEISTTATERPSYTFDAESVTLAKELYDTHRNACLGCRKRGDLWRMWQAMYQVKYPGLDEDGLKALFSKVLFALSKHEELQKVRVVPSSDGKGHVLLWKANRPPQSHGGDRPAYKPRDGGDRRTYKPREEGERPAYKPRDGGDRRTYKPREEGDRPAYKPRDGGDRRPYQSRNGNERYEPRRQYDDRNSSSRDQAIRDVQDTQEQTQQMLAKLLQIMAK